MTSAAATQKRKVELVTFRVSPTAGNTHYASIDVRIGRREFHATGSQASNEWDAIVMAFQKIAEEARVRWLVNSGSQVAWEQQTGSQLIGRLRYRVGANGSASEMQYEVGPLPGTNARIELCLEALRRGGRVRATRTA